MLRLFRIPSVAIRVFGRLELEGGTQLAGNKIRKLLEILACERGGRVSRDRLGDLLWRDREPRDVAATLQTYVSLLRRVLGGQDAIATENGGYRLTRRTDLDEFDELVADGGLASLLRALELARGEVLTDSLEAPWALRLREQYRRRRLAVLSQAARLALETEAPLTAARLAASALEQDPLREPDTRVLMSSLSLLDARAGALRAFDRCRRELRDRLGVDASPATASLHVRILKNRPLSSAELVIVAEDGLLERLKAAGFEVSVLAGGDRLQALAAPGALLRLSARRLTLG